MVSLREPRTFYTLWDKQLAFVESEAWLRGFVAGRGAGKTNIGAYDMITGARDGESCMVVSPSYVVMEETTWPTFKEVADQLGVWISGVRSPIRKAVFRTQDGGRAEATFRTGDKPDSLRGPNKAWLWYDEASLIPKDAFDIGMAVLRHKGTMGRATMTFTPRGKVHWTHQAFYERRGMDYIQKPNTHLVQAHTIENPFLPEEYYENIRGLYSEALAEQELAGQFVDLEGLVFRREWFEIVREVPADADRVRYWDKASTPGDGCYSAGVLMARDKGTGIFYVEDVVRGQWSADERNRIIRQTAEIDARKYNNLVQIHFEQEPGSGGKESAMITIRELAGHPVYRDIVSGSRQKLVGGERIPGPAKVVRAQPMAAQAEAGNVKILSSAWMEDYLAELCAFPEYKYSDQVDASSGAFNKICKHFMFGGNAPARSEVAPPDSHQRYGVQRAEGGDVPGYQVNRVTNGNGGAPSRMNRQGIFVKG